MAIAAGRKSSRESNRDDAADASRFFSRIGYLLLAVGAPVGVVLHPLGLYVMFSIGVGLILIAAALDAEPGFFERFKRPFVIPAFLALLAGLVWAALSILWTPYPVAAGQHLLKLGVLLAATMLAVAAPRENAAATDPYFFPIGVMAGRATRGGAAPRENAAATDLYLFPIGVMAGMATLVVRALVETVTGTADDGQLTTGAV